MDHDLQIGTPGMTGLYNQFGWRKLVREDPSLALPGFELDDMDVLDNGYADPDRKPGVEEQHAQVHDDRLLGGPQARETIRKLVPGTAATTKRNVRGSKREARVILLSTLIQDKEVQRKYQFTAGEAYRLNALRVADPADALVRANELMDERGFKTRVVAKEDGGCMTRGQAIAELKYKASTCMVRPGTIDCGVVMPKAALFFCKPNETCYDAQRGYSTFTVNGPVAVASSVVDYWTVIACLGHETAFAEVGPAANVLGVYIDKYISEGGLHWTTEQHASLDEVSDGYEVSSFTPVVDERFIRQARGLEPVLKNGRHAAYAYGPGDGYVYVNKHVRERGGAYKRAGRELRKYAMVKCDKELWCISDEGAGVHEDVNLVREPKRGESVVLMVRDLDDNTLVQTSECTISYTGITDGAWVVECAPNIMQHGMSGAPYIAVSDGAVVGIHDGYFNALGAGKMLPMRERYGGKHRERPVVETSLQYGLPSVAGISGTALDVFKKHKVGRKRLDKLFAALDHEGEKTLIRAFGHLAYMGSGRGGDVKYPDMEGELQSVNTDEDSGSFDYRSPIEGEAVLLVGRTVDGAFVTPKFRVETNERDDRVHVDVPVTFADGIDQLQGALVVALDDACVVAITTSQRTDTGTCMRIQGCAFRAVSEMSSEVNSTSLTHGSGGALSASSDGCVPYNGDALVGCPPNELAAELGKRFPYLGWRSYKLLDLAEAFSSPGMMFRELEPNKPLNGGLEYLARVGDAIMKERIQLDMRAKMYDHHRSTVVMSMLQNNAHQSRMYKQHELHSLLRRKRNETLSEHTYANGLEAIAAVIYLNDTLSNLDKWLLHVEMLQESY